MENGIIWYVAKEGYPPIAFTTKALAKKSMKLSESNLAEKYRSTIIDEGVSYVHYSDGTKVQRGYLYDRPEHL